MYLVDVAIIEIIQFTKHPSSYASRTLIPSGPQCRQLDEIIKLSFCFTLRLPNRLTATQMTLRMWLRLRDYRSLVGDFISDFFLIGIWFSHV